MLYLPILSGSSEPTAEPPHRHGELILVIAASALTASGWDERVVRLGVEYFRPKPYTVETLLRARDGLLSSAGP
jgi:hypothetical protein